MHQIHSNLTNGSFSSYSQMMMRNKSVQLPISKRKRMYRIPNRMFIVVCFSMFFFYYYSFSLFSYLYNQRIHFAQFHLSCLISLIGNHFKFLMCVYGAWKVDVVRMGECVRVEIIAGWLQISLVFWEIALASFTMQFVANLSFSTLSMCSACSRFEFGLSFCAHQITEHHHYRQWYQY